MMVNQLRYEFSKECAYLSTSVVPQDVDLYINCGQYHSTKL